MSVFDGIDWDLFREQKNHLIEMTYDHHMPNHDMALLEGLVNFLDHFQDCAAEELGGSIVFGDDE